MLYSQLKSSRCPLNRTLDGPETDTDASGKSKTFRRWYVNTILEDRNALPKHAGYNDARLEDKFT